MPTEQQIKDDFEERAAIREFDGGQPRGTAEFFAQEETLARIAQQGCLNHNKQYEEEQRKKAVQPPASKPLTVSQQVQDLQRQRNEIGDKIRAEKNEQRKDKLLAEWMDLNWKIIELRKAEK